MDSTWRKSSYSDANGGNCVECASVGGLILVRDTADHGGRTLAFDAGAWTTFTNGLK